MFGIGESETNALTILKEDHRQVEELFKQYESQKEAGAGAEKVRTAQLICVALSVHAAIEEGLFYPAARRTLEQDGKEVVDEAAVETFTAALDENERPPALHQHRGLRHDDHPLLLPGVEKRGRGLSNEQLAGTVLDVELNRERARPRIDDPCVVHVVGVDDDRLRRL